MAWRGAFPGRGPLRSSGAISSMASNPSRTSQWKSSKWRRPRNSRVSRITSGRGRFSMMSTCLIAEFFGIYPREAELIDPQQRLFLECCWQAFEDAGYDPAAYPGCDRRLRGMQHEHVFPLADLQDPDFIESFTGAYQVGNYPEMMGNNLDFLATRVAYKLNLRGPAFTMQAGCSTSLLAVCQACQSC